ncbi:unnamed protein product [Fusarium venenatum]|uniref:Uncharacterized protein n=1 Tax=Fusarium venenatum TaxID=56646 RepID=A0A2L2TBX3_9HYPO|nr:uncharacterized protein FVRRES_03941 [Fusarium venenatum]CEI67429.1 unnamed protein product [Fusarium venenatum]
MAAFGRLQAALASATNELTIAAANINFDFTLVKCEAPKEFEPLGSALSQTRKENAEGGTAHITARRLGVLFEGILPPTPALVKSYGTRVSEIAQAARKEGSPKLEESLFSAHVGADGTSIWAAATSSPTALHVQLLACMLARLWTASEATSIWVELVKERRKQIEGRWNNEEPLPFSTVSAAAQSDISRSSLAEWDASVRSWLRTADRFSKKRQDKLMNLLEQVNLPINHDTVYSSVMEAWKSAVETIEKIVKGMPQAVNEGSCLIALSSWHLYPDITVEGSDALPLQFSDPLVESGGFLTLGLVRTRDGDAHGVFWSLSLAHLNFYGRPVARKARFDSDSRKISFDQFTHAVYGALLAHWNFSGTLAEHPSRVFVAMRKAIERQVSHLPFTEVKIRCQRELRDPSSAINILSKSATSHLDAQPFPGDIIHKLMTLGGRRAFRFIPNTGLRPFLGLGDVGELLSKLKGPIERVAFLRRIVSSSNYDPDAYIIRYFDKDRSSIIPGIETRYCGFASAQPRRNPDGLTSTHGQWVPRSFIDKYQYPEEVVTEMTPANSLELASPLLVITMRAIGPAGEEVMQDFHLVCGDQHSAAIFKQQAPAEYTTNDPEVRPLSIGDVEWCLESDLFAPEKLLDILDGSRVVPSSLTLKALSMAHMFYRTLPDAGISPRSLDSPLYEAKWVKSLIHSKPDKDPQIEMNRIRSFGSNLSNSLSCVAYLEGGFDLEPMNLERLTCDPWDSPEAYELKRFTGNVGRSGVTLLVPPKTSMVMEREETSWRVISSSAFDGTSQNYFPKTSMHLSFTEYYVPLVQSSDVQEQSSQVFLLESVVSVYDSGRWIGDVDVLKCLASPFLIYTVDNGCNGQHANRHFRGVSSLETWDDVLDPPPGECVIRAQGCWLARLAIVTIFIEARGESNGERIAILSNDTCWKCYGPSTMFSQGQPSVEGNHLQTLRIPSVGRVIVF